MSEFALAVKVAIFAAIAFVVAPFLTDKSDAAQSPRNYGHQNLLRHNPSRARFLRMDRREILAIMRDIRDAGILLLLLVAIYAGLYFVGTSFDKPI